MSDLPTPSPVNETNPTADPATLTAATETPPTEEELKQKYIKYAMRNMVKKRSKSLQHFLLSTIGLLALFIGLSYLTR